MTWRHHHKQKQTKTKRTFYLKSSSLLDNTRPRKWRDHDFVLDLVYCHLQHNRHRELRPVDPHDHDGDHRRPTASGCDPGGGGGGGGGVRVGGHPEVLQLPETSVCQTLLQLLDCQHRGDRTNTAATGHDTSGYLYHYHTWLSVAITHDSSCYIITHDTSGYFYHYHILLRVAIWIIIIHDSV